MNKLFFNVIIKVSALLAALLVTPTCAQRYHQFGGRTSKGFVFLLHLCHLADGSFICLTCTCLTCTTGQLSPTVTTWFVLRFEFTTF